MDYMCSSIDKDALLLIIDFLKHSLVLENKNVWLFNKNYKKIKIYITFSYLTFLIKWFDIIHFVQKSITFTFTVFIYLENIVNGIKKIKRLFVWKTLSSLFHLLNPSQVVNELIFCGLLVEVWYSSSINYLLALEIHMDRTWAAYLDVCHEKIGVGIERRWEDEGGNFWLRLLEKIIPNCL